MRNNWLHNIRRVRFNNPKVIKTTYSNCCGAGIYDDTDICMECKEHCEPEEVIERIYEPNR